MAFPSRRSDRLWLLVTALIVVGGATFWLSDLRSDPPMYFSGLGQSLYTDPPQYTYHARNAHLFDDWDPFDYPKFAVFENSLISRLAWVWFSLSGISIVSANAVGVIASFLGLIALLYGLAKWHRPWVLAAVAATFVVNVTLLTHGRLPYLENGLLLLASLLFMTYARFGESLAGLIGCSILAALAMVMGKLFGLMLLPAVLAAVWFSGAENRFRRCLLVLLTFAVTARLLVALFYGGSLEAVRGYFGEQTYGLYGFPPGLSSPWGFVEQLMSYGLENRLYYLNADLVGQLWLAGATLAIWVGRNAAPMRNLPPSLRLGLFWLVLSVGALMPLGYSPIRYSLLFLPAIPLLLFGLLELLRNQPERQPIKLSRWSLIILGVVTWAFLAHLAGNLFFFNVTPAPKRLLVWSTLPGAALFAYFTYRYAKSGKRMIPNCYWQMAAIIAVAAVVVINGARIRRFHLLEQNFNIAEANDDLDKILAPGAVLSGPYGLTLTQGITRKAFIHHFGVAKVDSSLFDRYPVTHVAVDESNWQAAVKNYPPLKDLTEIAYYWICDNKVWVYNISQSFSNPEARQYQPSLYEQASNAHAAKREDSARVLIESFLTAHPDSKAGLLLYGRILTELRDYETAFRIYSQVAQFYPTDYNVQLETGYFIAQLASATGNQPLLQSAETYFFHASHVNRYRTDMAMRLWQTAQVRKP